MSKRSQLPLVPDSLETPQDQEKKVPTENVLLLVRRLGTRLVGVLVVGAQEWNKGAKRNAMTNEVSNETEERDEVTQVEFLTTSLVVLGTPPRRLLSKCSCQRDRELSSTRNWPDFPSLSKGSNFPFSVDPRKSFSREEW